MGKRRSPEGDEGVLAVAQLVVGVAPGQIAPNSLPKTRTARRCTLVHAWANGPTRVGYPDLVKGGLDGGMRGLQ